MYHMSSFWYYSFHEPSWFRGKISTLHIYLAFQRIISFSQMKLVYFAFSVDIRRSKALPVLFWSSMLTVVNQFYSALQTRNLFCRDHLIYFIERGTFQFSFFFFHVAFNLSTCALLYFYRELWRITWADRQFCCSQKLGVFFWSVLCFQMVLASFSGATYSFKPN